MAMAMAMGTLDEGVTILIGWQWLPPSNPRKDKGSRGFTSIHAPSFPNIKKLYLIFFLFMS